MKTALLNHFVDPEFRMRLELIESVYENGKLKTGQFMSRVSGNKYPIIDYIPRFVSSDNYASNFGIQWNIHSDTQLDSYTGSSYSRDRLFSTTGWAENLIGERILEAGSGAGRFTEILVSTGADIFSFDFSNACEANYRKNGAARNLSLFQGDIYSIPFHTRSFDKVLCLGVIQHTPDVRKTIFNLAEMVRPGGELVVDCYPKIWRAMIHWKYILRPITTRISPEKLYQFVSWYSPKLRPLARFLRAVAGRGGHRLVPVLDQSDKDVSPEIQRSWTILDTYDALSAAYDKPQSVKSIQGWFEEAGFNHIDVRLDGIVIGRGKMPE